MTSCDCANVYTWLKGDRSSRESGCLNSGRWIQINLTTETNKCYTKDCILLRRKSISIKDAGGSIMGEQSSMFDEYTNGSKFKCSETNDLNTMYYIFCFNDNWQTSVLLANAFSSSSVPSKRVSPLTWLVKSIVF